MLSLFDLLTQGFIKRWPTVNELEISGIPWFSVSKGIKRLRKIRMLE